MKEVFEKIIEKLEERSKEYNSGVRLHGKPEEMLTCDAIEIVKQEAEENNNGWIPCSERLPSQLDRNKVAMLTGVAIQDDETFKSEGGFIPERDQYYFEMKQGGNIFLVGFKDLLISLRLLEKMGEIPEIGDKWWLQMATLYGKDILMVEFTETE